MYECKTSINPVNKCKYLVCILNPFEELLLADFFLPFLSF